MLTVIVIISHAQTQIVDIRSNVWLIKKSENLNVSLQRQLAHVIILSGPITSPIRQEKKNKTQSIL